MPLSGTVTNPPPVTAPVVPATVELIAGALPLVIEFSPQLVLETPRTLKPDACEVFA